MAASTTQLAADIAVRAPGATATLVLHIQPWRLDTGAAEDVYVVQSADGIHGATLAGTERIVHGLVFEGYSGSAAGEGISSLIQGASRPASVDVAIEIPAQEMDGGFDGQAATINGAVAADATSMAVQALTAGREVKRGSLFRVAGSDDNAKAWHVVLDDATADGSGAIAKVNFWPPAPGAWSDTTKIVGAGYSELAPWWAYAWVGHHVVELSYTGRQADGQILAWASRGYLWQLGQIGAGGPSPDLVKLSAGGMGHRIELSLRAAGLPWTTPIGLPYAGLSRALRANGVWYATSAVTRPFVVTGDFWIRLRVWPGEGLRGGSAKNYIWATGTHTVSSTGDVGIYLDEADMKIKCFMWVASTLFTASTPAIAALEAGDVVAYFEHDDSADTLTAWLVETSDDTRPRTITAGTSAAPTGTYTDAATQTTLFASPGGANIANDLMLDEFAIGTTLPTTTAAREALIRKPRILEGDDGVHTVFQGDVNAAAFTEIQFHPTDPKATPQGDHEYTVAAAGTGLLGHSGEGNDGLALQRRTVVFGKGINVEADSSFAGEDGTGDLNIFGTPAGPMDAAFDGGVEVALDTGGARTEFEDIFATAPAASKYAHVGLGEREGALRFAASPNSTPSVDCWGTSLFRKSLLTDGSTTVADWTLTATQTMASDFTFMFWFWTASSGSAWTMFDSDDAGVPASGFRVTYNEAGSFRGFLSTVLHTSGATINQLIQSDDVPSLRSDMIYDRPIHFALSAAQDTPSAGELTVKAYINGRLVDTTQITATLRTPLVAGKWFRRRSGANKMPVGSLISEPQIYDFVLTAAEIQTRMNVDPATLAAASRPEHYYPAPAAVDSTSTTWVDAGETGGQDATITFGSGGWVRPLAIPDGPGAAHYVLNRVLEIPAAQIALDGMYSNLPDRLISLPLPGDTTAQEALDIISAGEGYLYVDPSTGIVKFQVFPDLDTATADATLRSTDASFVSFRLDATIVPPPHEVAFAHTRVGVGGYSPFTAATEDRRALIARGPDNLAFEAAPIAGAADAYPDAPQRAEFRSAMATPADARTAATTLAAKLSAFRRGVWRDTDWMTLLSRGDVVKIYHPLAPGGTMIGIVSSPKIRRGVRELEIYVRNL